MNKQGQAFTIYKTPPKDTRVANKQKERDIISIHTKEFLDNGGHIEVDDTNLCVEPKVQTGHCQPLM